ncbi:hypothetical protein, partial [Sphingomonas paucimobilis]|uniref:hypothetical protein n=1 Tax=Sphingomonas paucimobilis TaxID=13689 RepID=UPI001F16A4DD
MTDSFLANIWSTKDTLASKAGQQLSHKRRRMSRRVTSPGSRALARELIGEERSELLPEQCRAQDGRYG